MADILDTPVKAKRPREASFWQAMKQAMKTHHPEWSATRLESRATQGVPDVLILDSDGNWHLVELKTTQNNSVRISPHQVAFATKHAHGSCWIAVKHPAGVSLYRGDCVMDLRLDGLDSEPTAFFPTPVDWAAFFKTLAV